MSSDDQHQQQQQQQQSSEKTSLLNGDDSTASAEAIKVQEARKRERLADPMQASFVCFIYSFFSGLAI